MLYASEIGKALLFHSFFKSLTLLFRARGSHRSVWVFCFADNNRRGVRNMAGTKTNPRYKNGTLRRKHRARLKAMGLPCAICGGPIHYDEPSDAKHPLSFVIDEKIPVSKYWLGGYESREQCAQDWNNLQAVHYACNAQKGNKIGKIQKQIIFKNKIDGDW